MERHRITTPRDPDFAPLFRLYQSAFPLHEQRTRAAQEGVLSHPDYFCWALRERGAFAGLLLVWEGPGFRYVEHFAVAPELRGGGLGARALAWLTGQGAPVILEIDPPVDEISVGRRGFYLRCGFSENPFPHVHPPYRAGFRGHPLVVLSAPGPLSRGQYDRFAAYLAGTVMSDCAPPLTEA